MTLNSRIFREVLFLGLVERLPHTRVPEFSETSELFTSILVR